MPDKQHSNSPEHAPGTNSEPGWSEEEKGRGTPQAAEGVAGAEGADEAGTAGSATSAAWPTDDRAKTEQAAMAIEQAKKGP